MLNPSYSSLSAIRDKKKQVPEKFMNYLHRTHFDLALTARRAADGAAVARCGEKPVAELHQHGIADRCGEGPVPAAEDAAGVSACEVDLLHNF